MSRCTSHLLAAGLLLAVTGCASAGGSPDASPTDAEREQGVEVRVAVTDGTVRPEPRRVEVDKDSRVRLLVTSDVDDEVHVHGYEVEESLEAGRTTTVELVADQVGVFEVETHDSGLALLQLEVR